MADSPLWTPEPYGEDAMIAYGPPSAMPALARALRERLPGSQLEVIAGADCVVVRSLAESAFTHEAERTTRELLASARAEIAEARHDVDAHPPLSATVTLDVTYDGEDLAAVADATGLSPAEVIARHSARAYVVAFGGFAAGFAYLTGLDPALHLPRRATPRTSVPAGSVAIAVEYSAVYPRESPGGWHLLGRSDAVLFDPGQASPALLRPGASVSFRPVRGSATAGSGGRPATPARSQATPAEGLSDGTGAPVAGHATLRVLAPGPQSLVVDAGRPGWADAGVARSGAYDRGALARANLGVGNLAKAAGLEIAIGPTTLEALDDTVISVGGPAALEVLDESGSVTATADAGIPLPLARGARARVRVLAPGLRAYLAVAGGIASELTLGSASRDTMSRLGPEPLRAGDEVQSHGIGASQASGEASAADVAGPATGPPPAGAPATLRALPGPDAEDAPGVLEWLARTPWQVSPASDRVGLRLKAAPAAAPASAGHVEGGSSAAGTPERPGNWSSRPSRPAFRGCVQLPPNGEPILLGPDTPTTGGYPVIAVLDATSADSCAQLRPGAMVRIEVVAV